MEFKPGQQRFVLRGVQLNRPVDLMEDGYYPYLLNVRSYIDGVIRTRPGWTEIATTGADNQHSIKRLNDAIADTFAEIIGAGANLYVGQTGAIPLVDSGYSGDGLTFVNVAPFSTPRAWCYIGDSLRLRKVKADGTDQNWGIAPPKTAPLIQFGPPAATIIENFEATAGFVPTQAADPVITVDPRINTTITAIVFDSGATGWASIQPASIVNMGRGAVVTIGAEANVIIDSFYAGTTPTTIAAIIYDSGANGPCSIQLTAPTALGFIKKFSMLIINAEAVVVQDIIVGPDDIPSIRCTTVGAHSAGETVTGVRSFRAYFTVGHAAGQAITSNAIEVTINGAGDGSTVAGIITKAITVDCSLAGSRPINPENDELHLSAWVGKLNHFIDATFILDVDASVNDGTQNYYFKTLTVNDFASVDPTEASETVNVARLARLEQKLKNATQAGDFDRVRALDARIKTLKASLDQVLNIPIDDQTAIGDKQWHELRFKTKEFFRVGTDYSRTLKDVKAIILVIRVNKTRSLRFDSAWIGGTFGPDVGDAGFPYKYIYRYRSSETGARSAWSPPNRSGIEAHKQEITVTPVASADPQADKIDYARIGGALSIFEIIGTGPNTTVPFKDDLLDTAIVNNDVPDLNTFQPFVTIDLPRQGTCNVAGTSVVRVSGDSFNPAWSRNNVIVINNIPYSLYGPPKSTSVLELNQNAGAQTGVTFFLPDPELTGQALPAVWGPVGYGQTGVFIFACGDPTSPGDIVWTMGNDPDLIRDINRLSVCSPSEPLINGCVWDVRNFVFSSEGYFEIMPNFSLFPGTIQGSVQFVTQRIANSVGLFNRYCLAVGKDGIYFLSKDGIYFTNGGAPINITDDALFNLFPHEGLPGIATNGYNPIDMAKPMRLAYYDEYLHFLYRDTTNTPFILVYNTLVKGWVFDKVNSATMQSTVIYGEEGDGIHSLLLGGISSGGVGTLYQSDVGVSGTDGNDAGVGIICEVDTKCEDFGDVRWNKEFGDFIIDADTSNNTIQVTPGFDNYSTLLPLQNFTRNGRGISPPLDLNSGAHELARNMGLKITWTKINRLVSLYAWELSYVIKPVNTILRFTDWSDLGVKEPKFFHGIRLHADTLNVARSVRIQGDNGVNGLALTNVTLAGVQHDGESIIDYSFDGIRATPFIAHLVRLAPNDTNQWRLFDDYQFQFDLDSPLVLSYISQITANDLSGYQHIKDGYIAHISTANLSLVFDDDGVNATPIVIPTGSGIFTKTYFLRPAGKFKTTGYSLTSTSPFRLYKRACEFRGKAWGKNMAYQPMIPVGSEHYTEGPRL